MLRRWPSDVLGPRNETVSLLAFLGRWSGPLARRKNYCREAPSAATPPATSTLQRPTRRSSTTPPTSASSRTPKGLDGTPRLGGGHIGAANGGRGFARLSPPSLCSFLWCCLWLAVSAAVQGREIFVIFLVATVQTAARNVCVSAAVALRDSCARKEQLCLLFGTSSKGRVARERREYKWMCL
nr:uncharacterized protein LOC123774773 [Procambarus clarkii]